MDDAHQRRIVGQVPQQRGVIVDGALVKFDDQVLTRSRVIERVCAPFTFSWLGILFPSKERYHRTGHNELLRRKETAPVFPRPGVEVVFRFAATQQRVTGKETVNDFLGVRLVIVEANRGSLPEIDKAKARRDHGFALFLIYLRPFRRRIRDG